MGEITLGNLYDFNKSAMNSVDPLDIIEFNALTEKLVRDFMARHITVWMLLCNERKDYTVFLAFSSQGILNELRPTLLNRGDILSIEKQEDGNYEIWIRDKDSGENFVYYLFDYSFGLIQA